jgi:hypothetical protein
VQFIGGLVIAFKYSWKMSLVMLVSAEGIDKETEYLGNPPGYVNHFRGDGLLVKDLHKT